MCVCVRTYEGERDGVDRMYDTSMCMSYVCFTLFLLAPLPQILIRGNFFHSTPSPQFSDAKSAPATTGWREAAGVGEGEALIVRTSHAPKMTGKREGE